MRRGGVLLPVLLATCWAVLLVVTVSAVRTMGANAAGQVFLGDFAHPWRAQFNTDFSIHLMLVAAWMIWRAQTWVVGIVCAVFAINLGALFTIPFLLIGMLRARGDVRPVLLGRYWPAVSATAR